MIVDVVKIILPAATAFGIGILITPILTHYLYKYKAWKRNPGKMSLDGTEASEFNRLHEKEEGNVPRMGGIVIWGSALITIVGITLLAKLFPSTATIKLDFVRIDGARRLKFFNTSKERS